MDFLDFLKELGGAAIGLADDVIDVAVPGGEIITAGVENLYDFAFGDDTEEAGDLPGLPTDPGTMPGIPDFPGPINAAGGGGLPATIPPSTPVGPTTMATPAALMGAARGILKLLQAFPAASDIVQRYWSFAQEKVIRDPHSQAMWASISDQLPKAGQEALEQFLVGFPAPIGLSNSAENYFLVLKIAESGYTPEELCCTPGRK